MYVYPLRVSTRGGRTAAWVDSMPSVCSVCIPTATSMGHDLDVSRAELGVGVEACSRAPQRRRVESVSENMLHRRGVVVQQPRPEVSISPSAAHVVLLP